MFTGYSVSRDVWPAGSRPRKYRIVHARSEQRDSKQPRRGRNPVSIDGRTGNQNVVHPNYRCCRMLVSLENKEGCSAPAGT